MSIAHVIEQDGQIFAPTSNLTTPIPFGKLCIFHFHRLNEILLVVSTLCVSNTWTKEMTEIEALGARPNHCTYEYAYDMYGAHCAGLRLSKLPKLKGGIEVGTYYVRQGMLGTMKLH